MTEKKGKNEGFRFIVIITSVVILGIITLLLLRQISIKNKYVCSYIGGLWMKKDRDEIHRCYTYGEYYK